MHNFLSSMRAKNMYFNRTTEQSSGKSVLTVKLFFYVALFKFLFASHVFGNVYRVR